MAETERSIRILVVDDSSTMRVSLNLTLNPHYQVELAEDGREGLEKYYAFQPDIIILDLNMPHVDGFGVVEHIRTKARDQDIFILVLTAEDDLDYKPKALNIGANDFLAKPFDRTELMARIGVAQRQVTLLRRLRESRDRISQEIDMVASLQSKLLPQSAPYFQGLSIKTLYRPSGQASGDYFDYFPMGLTSLRLVMADVSGHGARAAFIMAIVRTLFRLTQTRPMDLREIMTLVNTQLKQIIGTEEDFVTVFAADMDVSKRSITYCNAGHCAGLLKHPSGRFEELAPHSPMLGFFDLEFTPGEVSLELGSELFLYTDGFYEWEVEPGRRLGADAFVRMARQRFGSDGDFLEGLLCSLDDLTEHKPNFQDDLTALWIKTTTA